MPINSGNKKTNNAFDQRAAGSDNAQVASLSGRIFNLGGSRDGGNPTAALTQTDWKPFLFVGLIAFVVFIIWRK